MTDLQKNVDTVVAWVFFAMCIGGLIIGKAYSHSDGHMHYPADCCSGEDCAPVTDMQLVDGKTVTVSKFGTHEIPPNLMRRTSQDHRVHVCIRYGNMVCVFYPISAKGNSNEQLVENIR